MKNRFTRLLSLALAMTMLVCMMPSIVNTASAASSIEVLDEPSWYCGELEYGVYDSLPGYPANMVFNKGDYWVTEFTWFVLADGRIGYCIQPYKPGATGSYVQNPGAWGDLTRYRQQGVGLGFLYGAPNNGKSSQADFVATEAVVRDMACGFRMPDTSFCTNGDNGSVFTTSPFGEKLRTNYPEAYAIYNQILADIAKHGTLPSFATRFLGAIGAAQTITLKHNPASGLWEASVTDTNGVLQHFNYSSSIPGLTITKSGNTLHITATQEAAAQLTEGFTASGAGFEFEDPSDVCTVWTKDASASDGGASQLISVMDAATDPVPSYFKIVAEDVEADVEVVKTSTDGKVDGITFSVTNNTTGETSTQVTDATGKFTFRATVGDSVTITETVPEGYVNDAATQTITVVGGTNTVTFSNVLRLGQITVNKTAETFSGVTQADGIYQPVYAEAPLAGAVFEIRAAAEIKAPDGSRVLAAGELADTITTDATGTATSKLLYLGKYTVTEITAPTGTALNPTSMDVTLEYTGTEGAVVTGSVSFDNPRQRAVLSLVKILEADPEFGITQGAEITSVKFGLYAAEAMTAADGSTIPADGLLEAAACDAEGKITFQTDLPYGARVYIQEIVTAEGYLLNDTKFPVDFPELNQDTAGVKIQVNNGAAIENPLIRGTILGKKVDEDGYEICGAKFGLFAADETTFTEETAILTSVSNEIGVFGWEEVPYGSYIVREIEPAPAFVLNETAYPLTIDEDGETVEITVENKFLTGTVKTVKVDADNPETKLSDAVFEIFVDVDGNQEFSREIDLLVGEMKETEPGTYTMEDLRYNGYFLHEKQAPENFLRDPGYYYFEIRKDGETVTVENEPGVGFVNEPMEGTLELTKTDVSTGKPLADAKYRITDVAGNVVAEGVTNKDGVVAFPGLRIGSYYYEEISAPKGYLLDSTKYPFEVKEDGEIVKAAATNTPAPKTPTTGDRAADMLPWSMAALLISVIALGVFLLLSKHRRIV